MAVDRLPLALVPCVIWAFRNLQRCPLVHRPMKLKGLKAPHTSHGLMVALALGSPICRLLIERGNTNKCFIFLLYEIFLRSLPLGTFGGAHVNTETH